LTFHHHLVLHPCFLSLALPIVVFDICFQNYVIKVRFLHLMAKFFPKFTKESHYRERMKSSSPAASDRTLASTSDENSEANNVVSTSDDVKPNSSAHICEPGLSVSISASQLNITSPTSSADSSKSRKRRLEDDAVAPDTVPPSSPDGAESGGSLLSSPDRKRDHAKNLRLGTKIETEAGMDHPAKKRRTEGQSENILDHEVSLSNPAGLQNLPNFVLTGTDEQATTPSTLQAAALETEECVPKPVTPQRTNRSDSSDLDAPTPFKKPRLDASPKTTSTLTTEGKSTSAGSPLQPDGSDVIIEPASAPKGSPFLTLPLELLSEILILTGSPQHVLAVARACKALCQTLLSPNAQFIWREARKGPGCTFGTKTHVPQPTPIAIVNPVNVGPGLQIALLSLGLELADNEVSRNVTRLPDPPPQFFSSEAAYAAFIFDSGTCDVIVFFTMNVNPRSVVFCYFSVLRQRNHYDVLLLRVKGPCL